MFTRVFATFIGLLWDNEACVTPKEHKNPQWAFCCGNSTFSRLQLVYSQKKILSHKSLAKAESSEHIKETQGKDFL